MDDDKEQEVEEVEPNPSQAKKKPTVTKKCRSASRQQRLTPVTRPQGKQKSVNSTSSTDDPPSPKLVKSRGPQKTARVWKYFSVIYNEAEKCDYSHCRLFLHQESETGEMVKVKCNYANKGRNTTTIRGHLQKCHKPEKAEMDKLELQDQESARSQPLFQQKVTKFFGDQEESIIRKSKKNPYPIDSPIYQRLKAGLTRLAACTSFTLSMVEAKEFFQIISDLDARAGDSLPSRNTLKKWVILFSEKVTKNLVVTLKRVGSFFVTIDIWSTPGLDKFFLGVVVRYFCWSVFKDSY